MSLTVKDIMTTDFDIIKVNSLVSEGIKKILKSKTRLSGYKTVSLIVLDEMDNLAGIVTMFDILYHLRPSFLNYDLTGIDLKWKNEFPKLIEDIKIKKIEQIMSRNIISVKSEDHVLSVIDVMIKNKYRRLPVIDNSKLVGVIYFSDVYKFLFDGI